MKSDLWPAQLNRNERPLRDGRKQPADSVDNPANPQPLASFSGSPYYALSILSH